MPKYYCIMRPPMIGGIPNSQVLIDAMAFEERRYIPEIDRMAWGWVQYERELMLDEVTDFELIREPREDEWE